ncbi:hypothetical protein ACKF11_13435 [Methylobacillus sp. Pita2]|uniref:hypothetical protein n=1 Tax=Methylobacillus sp. Pita2 TaxID=3383245 RepID=UPI0038B50C9E
MRSNAQRTMARTLQGDVFFDDALYAAEVESSLPVRIVYLALHTVADREGRFTWDLKTMRFLVLDGESVVESAMLELQKAQRIIRYSVDGTDYGQIIDFTKHQHINPRERASVLPAFTEGELIFHDGSTRIGRRGVGKPSKDEFKPSASTSETQVEPGLNAINPAQENASSPTLFPVEAKPQKPVVKSNIVRVNGYRYEQVKNVGLLRFSEDLTENQSPVLVKNLDDVTPVVTVFQLTGNIPELGISQGRVSEYDEPYPHGNNIARVKKAQRWMSDNPQKRKTATGLSRFLNQWISTAQNNGEDLLITPGHEVMTRQGRGVFQRARPDDRAHEVGNGLEQLINGGQQQPIEMEINA